MIARESRERFTSAHAWRTQSTKPHRRGAEDKGESQVSAAGDSETPLDRPCCRVLPCPAARRSARRLRNFRSTSALRLAITS
jgi:hypothetical protein